MADSELGAFDGMPEVVAALAPEVRRLPVIGEPRSSCSTCVMVPTRMPGVLESFAFTADVRCCTHHPALVNFLVGRALGRGGVSAEVMRARLRLADGVSAFGISPDARWLDRKAHTETGFGRDESLRCPFWVAGDVGCGIWRDRTAICRTWFCRCEHGYLSQRRWHAAGKLVTAVEDAMAERCIRAGDPPERSAGAAELEAWFVWCADYVDGLSPEAIAEITDSIEPVLGAKRATLVGVLDESVPPLPDVAVAEVSDMAGDDGGVAVCGYSARDPIACPSEVVDFFDLLDGRRTWRDAAATAGFDVALIGDLHRIGVLREPVPAPTTPTPAVLVPAMGRPLPIGDRVVLRGESRRGCVVAPASIFGFIAQLDGTRRWRPILGDIPAELVERLHRIGALVAP